MPRKLVCALGVFDGVHLGHAKILLRALKESEKINGNAAAVTFHMHPKNVVSPGYVPEALTSAEEKRDLMRGLGIRNIYTIEFTKAFSMLEPEAFARKILAKKLRPAAVVAGTNFRFGRRRAGNMAALNALGAELGFRVISVPLFRLGGKNVSSTGIRNLIRKGRVVEAAKMLGRHYSLAGTVARGNGIGRKLGFPTANLKIQDKAVPSTGVYAVKAGISGGIYDAVCNIGVNPTFNRLNKNVSVEIHVLSWSKSLYGKRIKVWFIGRLRNERRFVNASSLKKQIAKDIIAASRMLRTSNLSVGGAPRHSSGLSEAV